MFLPGFPGLVMIIGKDLFERGIFSGMFRDSQLFANQRILREMFFGVLFSLGTEVGDRSARKRRI